MGLDVTAYSKLKYVGFCPDRDDDEHSYDPETFETTHVRAYAYDAFPHALLGVPDLRTEVIGSSTFLMGGCFVVTPETVKHSFRAGSYGGYTRWRKGLAAQFNPYSGGDADSVLGGKPNGEGPFYELLWFADNEGTIAELAALSLLGDFRQHEIAYTAEHDEYDVQHYRDFTLACELAADGGLIDFH